MAQAPATILFDLDGTLVDTIELIMQCMEHAFAEFDGRRPPRDEWLLGLGIPLRTQIANHARSDAEAETLIGRYRVYQNEHQDRMTVAYDGVVDTMAALAARGHRMGIVTSKFHAGAHRALTNVGIDQHFGSIIGGDSVVNAKPHPEPVFKALAELGGTPDNAYFVGDSPHDINAGNAAGVQTVAATWGPFSREQIAAARPTHWIASINELSALVG